MADYDAALFVWQHHLLDAVFFRNLLCTHAGRLWIFQYATGRSIKYFRNHVADWLFPRWVVSRSLFITQAHICRPGDYGGRRVCILDDAVIRDMCAFVRPVGISNRVHVLVSDDQGDT